jgi:hypothetical protein
MLYNITQEICATLEGYIMAHGAASMPGVIFAAKALFRS